MPYKKSRPNENCTECFKSLSVQSRMDIYSFLNEHGPSTVNQIVDIIKLRQPTVSYHLKGMEKNGILKSEKRGKEVLYSIDTFCATYEEKCVLSDIKFPAKTATK